MQTWEYALFEFRRGVGSTRRVQFSNGPGWDKIPESDFMNVLARLGAEGWEMAGTAVIPITPAPPQEFYFKRPISPS